MFKSWKVVDLPLRTVKSPLFFSSSNVLSRDGSFQFLDAFGELLSMASSDADEADFCLGLSQWN